MTIVTKENIMQIVEKAITAKELRDKISLFDSKKLLDVRIKEVKKHLKNNSKEEQRKKAVKETFIIDQLLKNPIKIGNQKFLTRDEIYKR